MWNKKLLKIEEKQVVNRFKFLTKQLERKKYENNSC
jgi:hypothetical protein